MATTGSEGDFQSGVLKDGVITRAEMEQATVNYATCLRDAGGEGTIWFDYDIADSYATEVSVPSSQDPDAAMGVMTECENKYTSRLNLTYDASSPERTAKREALARACIQEKAPEVAGRIPVKATLEDMQGLMQGKNADPATLVVLECTQYFGKPRRDIADVARQ